MVGDRRPDHTAADHDNSRPRRQGLTHAPPLNHLSTGCLSSHRCLAPHRSAERQCDIYLDVELFHFSRCRDILVGVDIARRCSGEPSPVTAITPIVWGTTFFTTTQLLPDNRPLLAGTLRALSGGPAAGGHRSPCGRRAAGGGSRPCSGCSTSVPSSRSCSWPPIACPGGVAAAVGAIQPLVAAALGGRPARRAVQHRQPAHRSDGRRRCHAARAAQRGAARRDRRRRRARRARCRWRQASCSPRSGIARCRCWRSRRGSSSPAGS